MALFFNKVQRVNPRDPDGGQKTDKKFKTNVAFIGIIGLAIMVSCVRETEYKYTEQISPSKKSATIKPSTELCYGITYNDIIQNAQRHNKYLDDLYRLFNFDADDYDMELIRCINESDFDNIDEEEKKILLGKYGDYQYSCSDVQDDLFSTEVINNPFDIYYIMEIFDSTLLDTSSFEKISTMVDSIQYLAFNFIELTDVDMFIVLQFTEMIRSSSYYWIPAYRGGSGIGFGYLSHFNKTIISKDSQPNDTTLSGAIGRAVLADCATAAVSCIATAIGGAINPAAAYPLLKLSAHIAGIASHYVADKEIEKHKKNNEKPQQ